MGDITGVEEGGIITVKEGDADVKYVKESSLLEAQTATADLQKKISDADTTKSEAVKASSNTSS